MQSIINTLAAALASVAVTIGLGLIAALRVKAAAWLVARTSAAQRDVLHKIALEGMALAEITYKQEGGPAKLAQALDYVDKRLREQGIAIDPAQIRAAVEATVLDYNTKSKLI